MEVIKFSRSNFSEADAARLNATRPDGEVTRGMRTAATDFLMNEIRRVRLADPKSDAFTRVLEAYPESVRLVMEPLLVLGYVEKIDNIEEEA
jgi:hypothetical protein